VKCALRFLRMRNESVLTPSIRIADEFAAEAFDDALEAGGHLLDLLRAQILARHIDVFIQWHANASPLCGSLRRQAPRALREGSKVLRKAEHGTPGHAACHFYVRKGRPFSSRPGSSGSGL